MMELGPFDLVIGGSPSNELISSAGKGLYGKCPSTFSSVLHVLPNSLPLSLSISRV